MDKDHYAGLQTECNRLAAEALVLAELERVLDAALATLEAPDRGRR